jgi:acyl-CoA thioester hydrolase
MPRSPEVAAHEALVYAASVSVSPIFSMELVASAEDIDELDHVSNLVYVRWVQQVAEAHSSTVGYDHDAYRELGAVFVIRRHEIDYLAPAYRGDRIVLETWVESWKAASSVRMTRISRRGHDAAEPNPVVLARAKTLWALINLATGRPTRMPEELRAAFTVLPDAPAER